MLFTNHHPLNETVVVSELTNIASNNDIVQFSLIYYGQYFGIWCRLIGYTDIFIKCKVANHHTSNENLLRYY